MALVVFVNIPIAILAMVLALMTFHFDNETSSTENGRKSKLDIRGLTLFYIFIFFLLFAVMNTSHIYLNVIAFVVACIVAMILYKNEKSISMPFVPVKEFNKMIVLVLRLTFYMQLC